MAKKKTDKGKAVDEAKLIAKLRAGYKCEKCPKTKEDGWQMHGAHIIPVGYNGTAADPDNILCLCATCHSMGKDSSHQNPIPFSNWFNEKFPGRYDELWQIAWGYTQNPRPKKDWIQIRKDLKELTKLLTQG